MRTDAAIFGGSAVFFTVATAIYWYAAGEPAGTVLLGSMALVSALVATVLRMRMRATSRGEPQDDPDAEPGSGAGQEVGGFPSDSAMPVLVALACSIVAVGLVAGIALLLLGFVAFAVSLVVLLRESM